MQMCVFVSDSNKDSTFTIPSKKVLEVLKELKVQFTQKTNLNKREDVF